MVGNAAVKTAFPARSVLCCLGIALLIAADWSGDLVTAFPTDFDINIIYILSGVVCVLTFAYWVPRAQKLEALFGKTRILVMLGALSSLGRLLKTFGGALPAGTWAVTLGIVVYTICETMLLLLWLDLCCKCEARHASFIFPAAFMFTAWIYFVLRALDPWITTCIFALFPLLSAFLLVHWLRAPSPKNAVVDALEYENEAEWAESATEGSAETMTESGEEIRWSFPIYPVALMIIYNFVFYFSLALTDGPSPFGSLGMFLISIIALIAAAFFSDRYSPTLLYKLALPLMVAGLLLLGYLNFGRVMATTFTNASNVAFALFIYIILSQQCYRYSISAIWMFGIVKAFEKLTGVVGMYSGLAFVEAFPVGTETSNMFVAAIVVAMIALSAIFFNDRIVSKAFGATPVDAGGAGSQAVMSYYEQLVWECEKAARRYGLTKREEEVLELLVQNTTVADIAEKLYVSHGTAKTHVNHIYRKLDVHSRNEAVKLVVESGARGGSPRRAG